MSAPDDFAAARTAQALAVAEQVAAQSAPQPAGIDAEPESWTTFRDNAGDELEMLVAELLPTSAVGFIAGPPKRGKSWLALALALAVVSGRPYLGRFDVPEARPVLYLALEGQRAGIRARIGSMARGMGLDPEGDDLADLHIAYKPRGLNLSDPAWAAWTVEKAAELGAGLVVVDVLRRAANVREDNAGAQDFAQLLDNLAELARDGRALVLLHHFAKQSEQSSSRPAGERMTGSGALHGAYDAALFIIAATEGARRMTVEHDARDTAQAATFDVAMSGTGTAQGGGFGYRDTLHLAYAGDPLDPADELADKLRVILAADPDVSKTAAAGQLGIGRTAAAFTRAWEKASEPAGACVQAPRGPAHTATQAEREQSLGEP